MSDNNYNFTSENGNSNPYSNPYSQPDQMPQMQVPQQNPGSGFAIAAMIVGILSMTLCCIGGFLIGIVGIILGIVSMSRKESGRGMAIAGIVTSVIGILIGIFIIVEVLAVVVGIGNMSESELNELRDAIYEELEKEGYDVDDLYNELEENGITVPDEHRINESQTPFSGKAYRDGDDSVIYFSEDETFCWYKDDSDHDRNYYTGTFEVRMGDAAEDYVITNFGDMGMTEAVMDRFLDVYEEMGYDDDQFCCLSLNHDTFIDENGRASDDFDAEYSNYMGVYDDTVYSGAQIETAETVIFTQIE